jgi:ubiquinone biosynthesis protein UbiJ
MDNETILKMSGIRNDIIACYDGIRMLRQHIRILEERLKSLEAQV